MLRFAMSFAALIIFSYAALWVALQRPLVFRTKPINAPQPVSQLAPRQDALTFARTLISGARHLLLVTEHAANGIKAIDLTDLAGRPLEEPFEALDVFGAQTLTKLAREQGGRASSFAQSALLPAAAGVHHISFGTNFRDHGEEVDNVTPFRFPRLSEPTASRSALLIDPETEMIDYEVEICMRFDRAIATLDDFDRARKVLFLCGDFTDRKRMLEGMPGNEDTLSGIGFTDAKSLPGFFPTGPYMVVPKDWKVFVSNQAIGTSLNGASMQYTTGDKMIEDFRSMAGIALQDGDKTKWSYQGKPVSLLPSGRIEPGQVLLSGTAGGVLFRPPSLGSRIILGAKYVMTGRFLSGMSGFRSVVKDIAEATLQEKIMLMPGDEVIHHSSSLGTIVTRIEAR